MKGAVPSQAFPRLGPKPVGCIPRFPDLAVMNIIVWTSPSTVEGMAWIDLIWSGLCGFPNHPTATFKNLIHTKSLSCNSEAGPLKEMLLRSEGSEVSHPLSLHQLLSTGHYFAFGLPKCITWNFDFAWSWCGILAAWEGWWLKPLWCSEVGGLARMGCGSVVFTCGPACNCNTQAALIPAMNDDEHWSIIISNKLNQLMGKQVSSK